MLTEFGLKNFKAFGNTVQRAPLSKINLIYGPNSGGKSSFIQALLLLKQSMSSNTLIPRGREVDLGSFYSMIHEHDITKPLDFVISFIDEEDVETRVTLSYSAPDEYNITSQYAYILVRFSCEIKAQNDTTPILIVDMKRQTDSLLWAITEFAVAGEDLNVSNYGVFAFKPDIDELLPILGFPAATRASRIVRNRELDRLRGQEPSERISHLKLVASYEELVERQKGVELSERDALSETQDIQFQENEIHNQIDKLRTLINDHQIDVLTLLPTNFEIDKILTSIAHIGPHRVGPERSYIISTGNAKSVGIAGEFVPYILINKDGIIPKVNGVLEALDIGYTIDIRNTGQSHFIGDESVVVLSDKTSCVETTIADVGFGINQILPVIVQALITPEDGIICVEQPEIHLHPRLQASLADMIIAATVGDNQKQWIVETHSEMIMRRMQRRIREGELDPKDVSVIYVDPDISGDSGSTIRTLELDERGKFVDEWPHGFFDEAMVDLLGY